MKKRILGLMIAVFATFTLAACKKEERPTRGDGIFSEFTAMDFDGNIVDGSVFGGYKVTMVNVWATWCKPCTTELPALGALNGEYKDKGFQVIGIAFDVADRNYNKIPTAFATALEIVETTGANYRHLIPSKSLKGFLSTVQAVPVTVFVDGNGYQIGKTYNAAKSKAEWKKIIDVHLDYVDGNS